MHGFQQADAVVKKFFPFVAVQAQAVVLPGGQVGADLERHALGRVAARCQIVLRNLRQGMVQQLLGAIPQVPLQHRLCGVE